MQHLTFYNHFVKKYSCILLFLKKSYFDLETQISKLGKCPEINKIDFCLGYVPENCSNTALSQE